MNTTNFFIQSYLDEILDLLAQATLRSAFDFAFIYKYLDLQEHSFYEGWSGVKPSSIIWIVAIVSLFV